MYRCVCLHGMYKVEYKKMFTFEWIGSAPGRSGIGLVVVVVLGGGLKLFCSLSNLFSPPEPEECGCLVVVVVVKW